MTHYKTGVTPGTVVEWILSNSRPVPNGCIEWQGPVNSASGYGTASVDGKSGNAHRHVMEAQHGPLPRHVHACHRCDNRKCVNPDHLFLGTARENTQDALRKGRLRHGCGQGRVKATLFIPDWWPEAWRKLSEGVPKTRVAKDSGKSVKTVYKHLERQVRGEYGGRAA